MSQLSDIINQINNLTGYSVPTGSGYIISQSATPIGTGSVNQIVDYINGLTGYNIPYTDIQFVSGSNVPGPVIIYTPYAQGGTIPTNGILPGQIIRAEHILRIINALNGVNVDDIIISGSLSTSGSNLFDGNLSLPFIPDGNFLYTSGGFVVGAEIPSTASFAITASYAQTASYAPDYTTLTEFDLFTASAVTTSSFNNFTASYNTGSFTGSFIGLLDGTASWANNADTASNILGGKATHIPFFNTDTTLATSSMYQSGSSTVIINQDNATSENPEALYVWQSNPTSINVISGKGNLNSYLQLNIQNTNQGTDASSDVVATAGNGNESINYIDMGINSDNYGGVIGGPNDGYLYSTGIHLHIGNATPNQYVGFFAGGEDVDANMKLVLDANNQHQMTGSLEIDTDLVVLGGITGSLYGTASHAVTASYASNVPATASFAVSASYALNARSASYAQTASHAPAYLPLTGGTINGNVAVNGTASIAFLNVTYESASVIYSSGSNVFGDATNDIQTLIGTVKVSGSQQITGSLTVSGGITGSLHGTASWSNNATTASYILQAVSSSYALTASYASNVPLTASYALQASTASYVLNAISSSYALTASYALNVPTTASYALQASTASYVQNAQTASYVLNAQTASFVTLAQTASYVLNAVSSSYALTASHALQALTASYVTGSIFKNGNIALSSSYSISSSYALTASYAANVPLTASYALQASTASYVAAGNIDGIVTSASYAIQAGNAATANFATTAGNGGVTSIVAGSGITLPFGGTGNVTIIASGGGGVTIISGSIVTGSFVSTTSYTFNHNLGIRTPIITVFDSNYNQVIPQNIQLIDTASAIITFPTQESGFAVGSTGGTTGTALSSSYSLFSTYASTASYYVETDPVFVAKSGSFATTGSNRFNGNQIITGSLIVSGSNTITVIGPTTVTGSLLVTGSTTQIGNNTLTGNTVLSGSISVSGSQTFIGNQTITGSLTISGSTSLPPIELNVFGDSNLRGNITISGSSTIQNSAIVTGSLLISGSTIQIGNNTLTGNTVLSGSITVSGSQNFKGNLDLTGSLVVSGSTVQIGNNTLTGNTSLTGSIVISGSTTNEIIGNTEVLGAFNVSGSSIFRNSTFTVTGSTFVKGTTNISGSTNITGSLNVTDGDINIVSGSSFRRWGNKLFNYGAFSDYTTQSGSADTAYAVRFNTTDVALGISLSGSSAMKIENKGIYNFQWSGQLHQGANAAVVSVWLKINGTDVPGSRGDVTLASNDDALPSWNYVLPFNANDAVELYWSSTRATTSWVFSPTGSAPPRPSTASIIATITQIA